jgi:transcriptional regulator with XRE-family HTH domain
MAIAELLRNARERRGVTLDRLAEETKIPRDRLAAFEQEGFRPDGGFYQRAQRQVLSVLMAISCLVVVAVVAATQFTRDSNDALHPAEAIVQPASGDAVDPPIHRADDIRSLGAGEPASRATVGVTEVEEAPATAAVPPVTELVITSQPEGARVTVDGVGWGVTPLTIRHLPEGTKRFRLTSDGYVAAERVMHVQPGGARTVAVELRRASPSVAEP